MTGYRTFLIAASAILATTLAAALILFSIGERQASISQSQVPLPHEEQTSPQNGTLAPDPESQSSESVLVSNRSNTSAERFTDTIGEDRNLDRTSRASARGQNVRETENPLLENEADTYRPHIPLVFLDYAQVLPRTDEVTAAVQKLQQDFIDSTDAATADPADPGYVDRWNQFQPTSDERFYAIFGVEAFNALSIMEVHQRGGF